MPSDWDGTVETVRERQALDTRWIAGIAVGTVLFLVASLGALWLFYGATGKSSPQAPVTPFSAPAPPGQRTVDPNGPERDQTPAGHTGDATLMPIEDAMRRVVARGDKAYDPPEGDAP